MVVKSIEEITSIEWALNEWAEVSADCDPSQFVKGRRRTPSEAVAAEADFIRWVQMRRAEARGEHYEI